MVDMMEENSSSSSSSTTTVVTPMEEEKRNNSLENVNIDGGGDVTTTNNDMPPPRDKIINNNNNNKNNNTMMMLKEEEEEENRYNYENGEKKDRCRQDKNENDSSDDEINISKAIKFWNNQSLRDVPIEQKFDYLLSKGITNKQIHKAWDRIIKISSDESETTIDGHRCALNQNQNQNNQNQQGRLAPSSSPSPSQIHPSIQQSNMNTYPPSSPTQHQPPPANGTTGYYGAGAGAGGGGMYNQQQQQQQQPYYNGSYYDDTNIEDSNNLSIAQGISLVALGGFVGVTAAAAMRWLNGGDFQLLPPPTFNNNNNKNDKGNQQSLITTIDQHHQRQRNPNEEEEEDEMFEDEEDDEDSAGDEYDDDDDDEEEILFHEEEEDDITKQQIISEKLDSISKTFQSYVTVQENILHKLATTTATTASNNNNNSTITNSSMEYLKRSNDSSSRLKETTTTTNNGKDFVNILIQLVEIKSELRRLKSHHHDSLTTTTPATSKEEEENNEQEEEDNTKVTEQERQISKSLTKLDNCLDKIVNVIGTTTATNGNNRVENSTVGYDKRNSDHHVKGNKNDVLLTTGEEVEEGPTSTSSSSRRDPAAPTAETTTGHEDVQTTQPTDKSNMESSSAGAIPDGSRSKVEEGDVTQRPLDSPKNNNGIEMEENQGIITKPLTLYEAVEILAGDENNDPTSLRIGCQILYLYFVNLVNKPDNIRYRKIFTSNESYSKIDKLKGAKELLCCVGFQLSEKGDYFEWLPKQSLLSTDGKDGNGQDNDQQQQEDLHLPKLKQGVSVLSILKSGKPNLKDAALAAISSSV